MAKTRKRQRNHPFPRSPSDSASKTAPRTIWIGSGAIGRYIVVTSAVQDLVQLFFWTAGSGPRRSLRPCRRLPVGLLLLPAWAATVDDTCMAYRPDVSGHRDDEICHEVVLVVVAHFTAASWSCRLLQRLPHELASVASSRSHSSPCSWDVPIN